MDLEDIELGSTKRKKIIPSNWRLLRNAGETNILPGYDDLNKILMFMKKGAHDCEIMEAFGLNAMTMQAIRDDRYHPVDGVDYDTLTKIQNEFIKHEKQIEVLVSAITELVDTIYFDSEMKKHFMAKTKFKRAVMNRRVRKRPLLNDEVRICREVDDE